MSHRKEIIMKTVNNGIGGILMGIFVFSICFYWVF